MSHLDTDEEIMEWFHFDEDSRSIGDDEEENDDENDEDMIDPLKDSFFTQTYDV